MRRMVLVLSYARRRANLLYEMSKTRRPPYSVVPQLLTFFAHYEASFDDIAGGRV
jgi:hypothetical protein